MKTSQDEMSDKIDEALSLIVSSDGSKTDYHAANDLISAFADGSYANQILSEFTDIENADETFADYVSDEVSKAKFICAYINAFCLEENEKDYGLAREYFDELSDNGNGAAALGRGILYRTSDGTPCNADEADKCFQSAIDSGIFNKETLDAQQLYLVGYAYLNCYGVELDYEKAFEYLTQSAQKGNVLAMNAVGNCYLNGFGTEQDYSQAMSWYEKAASLGSTGGYLNIGSLYYHGFGVDRSYEKALE